ncbi:hypothetical protein PMAC_000631 [Pneumocystis sp. 'macacae']|nr:hypothetical protein PMAC_000631 [Pneumocystis sp. 'macacae']
MSNISIYFSSSRFFDVGFLEYPADICSLLLDFLMPFFGLGYGGSGAGQAVNPQKVSAAENELDMITDLFTSTAQAGPMSVDSVAASVLVDACHNKCIPSNYTDSELNKGESVCIDRCVAKFFEVNAKIGEHMQTLSQNARSGLGQPFGR